MKIRAITVFLAIIIMLGLGVYLLERQTKVLHRFLDDVIYDNRNHYLPCEMLPTEAKAREVVEEHADVIRLIEQVDPGNVEVIIDSTTCPGKADLLIGYPSHRDRLGIEAIIAGETFYGIPYRLLNW